MWKWVSIRLRRAAEGDVVMRTCRDAGVLRAGRSRVVLVVMAAAGVLGAEAQAGWIMARPVRPDAFPWVRSAGATIETASAPLPRPFGNLVDGGWMRGSLYGAINWRLPERMVVPRAYWPVSGRQYPSRGSIEVLSGGGGVAVPGVDGLTILPPADEVDISAAAQGANAVLSLGGTSIQAGSSTFLEGGDWMDGALTFSGGVSLLSGLDNFSLSLGTLALGGLTDGYGNQWTVGPDGTLTPMVNTLATVPEPGSLATAGLGFILVARLVRRGRRFSPSARA